LPSTENHRNQTDLFAEILEQCKQPTVKTHIMYKVNLSYPSTMKFLSNLQNLQLLKFDETSRKYKTTEKGLDYLKRYYELQKALET
jgi:predicted transcriptional regulator